MDLHWLDGSQRGNAAADRSRGGQAGGSGGRPLPLAGDGGGRPLPLAGDGRSWPLLLAGDRSLSPVGGDGGLSPVRGGGCSLGRGGLGGGPAAFAGEGAPDAECLGVAAVGGDAARGLGDGDALSAAGGAAGRGALGDGGGAGGRHQHGQNQHTAHRDADWTNMKAPADR